MLSQAPDGDGAIEGVLYRLKATIAVRNNIITQLNSWADECATVADITSVARQLIGPYF